MKVICIGFGVVARTLIPLMLRLGLCSASEVTVICDEDDHLPLAQALGVSYCHVSITRDNHLQELGSRLQPHALLLNLSVGVSSPSLIKLAQAKGAMYLDTGATRTLTRKKPPMPGCAGRRWHCGARASRWRCWLMGPTRGLCRIS